MNRILLTAAACFIFAGAARADLSVKEGSGVLEIRDGAKLITKFVHQGYSKPVFYPVNAPSGVPLTRAWPLEKGAKNETTDHPHQKSAWFCHGDIVAEGLTLAKPKKGIAGSDFWAEGSGKIVCTKVEIKKKEKNHVVIVTTNAWMSPDGVKILDETRVIHVHKLEGAWLIVCESDLSAPTYNIVFEDTKEGSFGVRMNDQIAGKNSKGKIENAEGKIGEKQCWGYPSAWCDYSGPIDGQVAGLAILADPKNPHASCWHVREYGLMAANPFGRAVSGFPAMKGRKDLVRLERGQHTHYRYGILLHDGDASAGRVASQYERFVALRGKN
jgi:hypothetical protein